MIEFALLGRSVRADHLEPHWEGWLRSHWYYPHHNLAAHGLPGPAFTLTLTQQGAPPALEVAGWTSLGLLEQWVAAHLEARCVTLGDSRSGARLEVSGNGANLEFWGAGLGLGAMLHALISEALRVSGLLSLHASAGVRNGQVTAFLGVGGAGKTTTLLRAWRAGWQPICEDLLWLEPASLVAYGWDRGLRLLPDTLERFSGELPDLRRGSEQDKWFVPYAELGLTPSAGRLTRVALLAHGDSVRTSWTASSRRETAIALWQATGFPLTEMAQSNVSVAIAALTNRLEGQRLILGRGDFSPLPEVEADVETTD